MYSLYSKLLGLQIYACRFETGHGEKWHGSFLKADIPGTGLSAVGQRKAFHWLGPRMLQRPILAEALSSVGSEDLCRKL